ncbi:MAG: ligase-associated DNA damage response exonuclease [Phycisphaerales bacterium]
MPSDLLQPDDRGLSCSRGGFHIDPWAGVPVAIVTHAHGDHARPGSGVYYCAREGESVLRRRLGADVRIVALEYGERKEFGSTVVSLHPAGHVRGSAQVRVEDATGTWVAAGDYKRNSDPTCSPFEVVPCDVFITETTFAMPIYRWEPTETVIADLAAWWERNAIEENVSVVFCYSLGKAHRVLAEVRRHFERRGTSAPGEVFVHGGVQPLIDCYRADGVALPLTTPVIEEEGTRGKRRESFAGQLVVAPPSAAGTRWMKRFGASNRISTAFVSGWMQIRGIRRRRGYDRGFVLSDHADWPDLIRTVKETAAKRVLCTHGYTEVMSRYLNEIGLRAETLRTQYGGDEAED